MCPSSIGGSPHERVPCAGAVVRDEDGRLLLIRRAQDPSRGLWSLPGGRVEAGESAAEAAARECQEETGLSVEVGAVLLRVHLGCYDIEDFAATVTGGALRAGSDAADVRWCTPAEVAELAAAGELTTGLLDELRRANLLP